MPSRLNPDASQTEYYNLLQGFILEMCIGFEATFNPSASIPLRMCKCHGRADDDCVLSRCRQSRDAAARRPREHRLSIFPVSIKSCLSAKL